MAASESASEMDCSCPVCCDIFKDPVVLLCGHSFCKYCLQEWWRQSRCKTCPVCKEIFPMAQPPRNLALRNLSDTLRQERSQRGSSGSKELCSLHGEKLKLFCQDDQELICVICRDAKKHKQHNCVPINEAVEDYRTKLKVKLMHLKTKRGSFEKEKVKCDKMASHITLQAQQTEKGIKEEFQKLYQFLRAEETARIDALRKEATLKSEAMKIRIVNLTAEISSLSDKIKTMEGEMKAEDFSFMLNVKSSVEWSQCNLPQPETPSGALIDEAKYLGNLLFTVWRKMKDIIQYTPVTFNPNTSGKCLTLSENLTRATSRMKAQKLPDNPERKSDLTVIGYESFSSGKHSWDVEVDKKYWAVGVTARYKHQNSEKVWGISLYGCQELIDLHSKQKKRYNFLSETSYPKMVRVQLDYDHGILNFFYFNMKTPLHTIRYTFTEPVFPYFMGCEKVLPAQLSVRIRQPK
ncbi:zinc-binding protein A33-like [Scomber japonicus]|uniref:zinc-binding protein A33-like n=1 Tax=Scomber japonicus TaxID=13676 RepID=UPI00230620FA|nr:zinc-binding protein A33-like [Scomber japonicus]